MELCDVNLERYLIEHNHLSQTPMNILHIWDIIRQIAAGVAFIHEHGKVHRDLKPRNGTSSRLQFSYFLVLYLDRDHTWKIADFGLISEGTSTGLHTTSNSRGTDGYRAPELMRDERCYNNKSDIWSMGCMLYELASERKVFSNDYDLLNYAHGHSISKDKLRLPPDIYIDQRWGECVSDNLVVMLEIEPSKRPSARHRHRVSAGTDTGRTSSPSPTRHRRDPECRRRARWRGSASLACRRECAASCP